MASTWSSDFGISNELLCEVKVMSFGSPDLKCGVWLTVRTSRTSP